MTLIAPSLLSADFAKLGEEALKAEQAGADMLHFDVMDGMFVPNITFGPAVVKAVRPHVRLPLDVHLMIEKPERYVEAFAEAGADLITVHAEACVHLDRTLQLIRSCGKKAGVSFNPATAPNVLDYVLDKTDLVLIMTVNPGFGGQSFLDSQLPKIHAVRELAEQHERPDLLISVDGGVNARTAPLVKKAGADMLVAGSAVFSPGADVALLKKRMEALRGGPSGSPFAA